MRKYLMAFVLLIIPILVFPEDIGSMQSIVYSKIVIRPPRHRRRVVVKRKRIRRKKTIWFGVNGGYDITSDVWNAGGQFKFPAGPFCFMPGASVYFTQNNLDWQSNFDIALAPRFVFGFYGGVGLAIAGRDTSGVGVTDARLGLNLFGGYQLPLRKAPVRPYTEFRCTFLQAKAMIQFNVGLDFAIGRI